MKDLTNINTQAILEFAAKNTDLFASKKSPHKILNQISDVLILFLEIEKHHYKKDYQALLDRMALIDQGYSFDEVLKEIPHPKKASSKKVDKKLTAEKKTKTKTVKKTATASKKVSDPKKVRRKK